MGETVQPFDNALMTMDLTGAQIYAVLEQQFPPTQGSMRLLQESGLKYTFNLSMPVGSRITSLTLTDGTPIDLAATYSVTLNEYIGTGGDGFSVFKQSTNVIRLGTGGVPISDLTALIEYIAYKFGTPPANTPINPTVYPKIEGRITNATP